MSGDSVGRIKALKSHLIGRCIGLHPNHAQAGSMMTLRVMQVALSVCQALGHIHELSSCNTGDITPTI